MKIGKLIGVSTICTLIFASTAFAKDLDKGIKVDNPTPIPVVQSTNNDQKAEKNPNDSKIAKGDINQSLQKTTPSEMPTNNSSSKPVKDELNEKNIKDNKDSKDSNTKNDTNVSKVNKAKNSKAIQKKADLNENTRTTPKTLNKKFNTKKNINKHNNQIKKSSNKKLSPIKKKSKKHQTRQKKVKHTKKVLRNPPSKEQQSKFRPIIAFFKKIIK